MKALIHNNQLVDRVETEFDVAEGMSWMDCPTECLIGRCEVVDGILRPIAIPEIPYDMARQRAYPSLADQLDDIFHNGVDGWKKTIQAVKDANPKP